MSIKYIISKDSEREYYQAIHNRIKELKDHKLDTESRICELVNRHAKKHGCIGQILRPLYCELTFWRDEESVHTLSRCRLNGVASREVYGFCEMFFSYDIDDETEAIVKVYKLNYCNLDYLK